METYEKPCGGKVEPPHVNTALDVVSRTKREWGMVIESHADVAYAESREERQ